RFPPQHLTVPLISSAHGRCPPFVIEETFATPVGVAGLEGSASVLVPLPSSPSSLAPQQRTVRSLKMAHDGGPERGSPPPFVTRTLVKLPKCRPEMPPPQQVRKPSLWVTQVDSRSAARSRPKTGAPPFTAGTGFGNDPADDVVSIWPASFAPQQTTCPPAIR